MKQMLQALFRSLTVTVRMFRAIPACPNRDRQGAEQ